MFSENYSIIGIIESWLNVEARDYSAKYKIPGYTTFEKSRVQKNGSVILFYIKTSLNPVLLSKHLVVNIDAIFILLKNTYGMKLLTALKYGPPTQPV